MTGPGIEPDLAAMLAIADDLEDAENMRRLEDFLNDFDKRNSIRKWIVSIMRKGGWREAYKVLQDYTASGCGISG